MTTLSLTSPAKLNLFLHITGRRANGYHELQTIFQLLDYGDDITIESRTDRQITLNPEIPGVPNDDNLIIKAAQLLQQTSQTPLGANITIKKRLPMGGGLGGGSSNAATTLIGLNHLWKTGIGADALSELGLHLGADVPVFVHGSSAWAEGIGEILTPLTLPEHWYLVVKPPCHVATEKIFSHEQLTRDTSAIKVATFFEQGGHNDCEKAVSQSYPEVAKALQWLRQFGVAQLTGTGACVFASFTDYNQAKAVLDITPSEWKCFIAKGINHSPIQHLIRD